MLRPFLLFLLTLCILQACNQAPNSEEAIESSPTADSLSYQLDSIYQQGYLPGFAVAIFDKDSIHYQKGFGYADVAAQKPYTPQTQQLIASISKTLVGVSLMQAVEREIMKLDDPVNVYLPFEVAHPAFPEQPITLRQLASHTSSIGSPEVYDKTYLFQDSLRADQWPESFHPYLEIYNSNQSMPMEEFLEKILSLEGDWYQPEHFLETPPGTTYEYSNLGVTLLALAIERATNTDFRALTQNKILSPLQMTNSTWSPQEVNPNLTTNYYLTTSPPHHLTTYHLITYPDGGLFSTVTDLTKYTQELLHCAAGEGTILDASSFQEMIQPQYEDTDAFPDAICWDLSFAPLVGHSGNDFGTSTLLYFHPETGVGRILFANVSLSTEEEEAAFYGVFNTLFAFEF